MQTFEEFWSSTNNSNWFSAHKPGVEELKQVASEVWKAAVEAARADLLKPSPCGQTFPDGTPHPMACCEFIVDNEHPQNDGKYVCLICDSEAKLRAERDNYWKGEYTRGFNAGTHELTALREGLAGLVKEFRDTGPLGRADNPRGALAYDDAANRLSALLTPPAASGRQLCNSTSNIYGPCILPAGHKGCRASLESDTGTVHCERIGSHKRHWYTVYGKPLLRISWEYLRGPR